MSSRKTISADRVRNEGERVTLDFDVGGYGIGFLVDGHVFTEPSPEDFEATEIADDLGSGLNEAPEEGTSYEVIRDGGDAYDETYNLNPSGGVRGPVENNIF